MKSENLGLLVTLIFIIGAVIVLGYILSSYDIFSTTTTTDIERVPDDIEIVDYDAFTIEGYNKYSGIGTHYNVDRYEIEGVVKNNLDRTLEKLTVIVTFYDGYHIAGYGYAYLENLAPSHSMNFKVSVSDYSLSFGYMPDGCGVSAREGHIQYRKP